MNLCTHHRYKMKKSYNMSKLYTQDFNKRAKEAIKQEVLFNMEKAVPDEVLNEEIDSLKEIIKFEKFFFVVDSLNMKIMHANGILKWLGYEDSTFSLDQYFKIIHESFMNSLIHLAGVVSQMANSKELQVGFRQQHYVINVALRHAKGHYVLCKRSLSAWQWGYNKDERKVTQYCNEFTIINNQINEINPEIFPRILDQNSNKIVELEKQLHLNVSKAFEDNSKMFSPQEFRILRKLAYFPSIHSSEIAKMFKTQPSTIQTLNKRIILKGRQYFQDESISTAKEVAILLRRNFLV